MESPGLALLWWALASVTAGVSAFSPLSGDDVVIDGLSYSVQNANRPWSIQNPDPDTLRFEVRPGDVWFQDTVDKERSEIAGETLYAPGDDIAVSYDFRVAPGPENTSDWLVMGQLHSIDDFSTPIFAVELIGERLAIHLRDGSAEWFAFGDYAPIVRGKYYHVEARIRLNQDERGSVDVWLDGEHIVDYSGPIGYGDSVYWKQGVYRAASPETIAVDYRDLWIARKAAERAEGMPQDGGMPPGTQHPGSLIRTN
jgi:hypothetical protein